MARPVRWVVLTLSLLATPLLSQASQAAAPPEVLTVWSFEALDASPAEVRFVSFLDNTASPWGGCDGSCGDQGGFCQCGIHSSHVRLLHEACSFCTASVLSTGGNLISDLPLDYREFYCPRTMTALGISLGAAAVLANTSLDQSFNDWHADHVHGHTSDSIASNVKWLGDGRTMLPIFVGAALADPLLGDGPIVSSLGQWGNRCLRSFAVGGPPVLVLQRVLGASRPIDGVGSHWKPFDDSNGVSGHTFLGATPFINAAMMTDRVGLKIVFYSASTLTGWSRINDEDHYLSQVLLGWCCAYLAADVVDRNEWMKQNFVVIPDIAADRFGVVVGCQW